MKIKIILLALTSMVSFAGVTTATETCDSKSKCSTKKTECATKCKKACTKTKVAMKKCGTKCDSKKECCSTKGQCCSTKGQCATKCKEACTKTEVAMNKCGTKCDSKKKCASKTNITHFKVSGMTCGSCSKKLTSALAAVKGVEVKKVCHKSGCVDVVLSKGTTAAQVKKTIIKSGFKITPKKKG